MLGAAIFVVALATAIGVAIQFIPAGVPLSPSTPTPTPTPAAPRVNQTASTPVGMSARIPAPIQWHDSTVSATSRLSLLDDVLLSMEESSDRARHTVQVLDWSPPPSLTVAQHRTQWSRFMHSLTRARGRTQPLIIRRSPLIPSDAFPSASRVHLWTPDFVARTLDAPTTPAEAAAAAAYAASSSDPAAAAAAAPAAGDDLPLERVIVSSLDDREVVYLNVQRVASESARLRRRMVDEWNFPALYFDQVKNQSLVDRMTAAEFFSSKRSIYWSQGGSAAVQYERVFQRLVVPDFPSEVAELFHPQITPLLTSDELGTHAPQPPLEALLWMGRNVSNSCHSDGVHNFFTQLHGTKRFLLFPPRALTLIRPYPRVHPAFRHTQLNFTLPSPFRTRKPTPDAPAEAEGVAHFYADEPNGVTRAEFLRRTAPVVAVVAPGDVLYLPPLWYHHVTTLPPESAISLSLWTQSADDQLADAAEHVPIPIDSDWSIDQINGVAAAFVWTVLSHLTWTIAQPQSQAAASAAASAAAARDTLTTLIRYRFPFFDTTSDAARQRAAERCPGIATACSAESHDAAVRAKIDTRALRVADLYNRLNLTVAGAAAGAAVDPDLVATKQTHVFGYVELVWDTVLNLNSQIDALPYCLARMNHVC